MEDTVIDVVPGDRKRKTTDEVEEVDGEARCAKESKIVTATSEQGESVEGGDPYLRALMDVQHAHERAIAIGKERLGEIESLYYTGQEPGQDQQIVHARTLCNTSMAQVDALTIDLASKFNRVPIYKLPEEVVLQVFSNLDLSSLFACEDTCWIWKKILATPLAHIDVWANAPLIHHERIIPTSSFDAWTATARSFRRIHKMNLQPSIFKLKAYGRVDAHEMSPEISQGMGHFPSEGLRDFRFYGSHNELWRHVAGCPLLKTLHWRNWSESDTTNYYSRYDPPLCKLEEFDFSVSTGVRVDKFFVQMLSEVKRLRICNALGMDHVRAIFDAAQATVEEVAIDGIAAQGEWRWGTSIETMSSFQMSKLHSISLSGKVASNMSITAPNVTTVSFNHRSIDWTLLDSCRKNIKSLCISLHGSATRGRFGQELFDMPQLELLKLNYTRDLRWSKGLVTRYEDYSASAFWKAIRTDDIVTVRKILPKLKTLTIIHDPMLEESIFLKYIEMRTRLEQIPLQKVQIYLADHCSSPIGRLEALKTIIPDCDIKRYGEWTFMPPVRWLKKDRLYYHEIYWDELEMSRSTLELLRIEWTSSQKTDERLQRELFNMPRLTSLTLDFALSKAEGTCAAALWTAYMTDDVALDSGVALRNILPRLETLVVLNDSMLNEDIIIKMLETRERLSLKPMHEVIISLASKCSDKVDRLEKLKKTMSQFEYKKYNACRGISYIDEEEEVISEVEES